MTDPELLIKGGMLLMYIAAVVLGLIALLGSRFAPVRTVKAQVVEKFKDQVFSRSQGLKQTRYFVVFEIEGKKRTFQVSNFSYGGYRIRERGTLKYKGGRILDFH